MSDRQPESFFAMSAFSGVLAIRIYFAAHPGLPAKDAIAAVKHVAPDDAYHDYDAALVLHECLGDSCDHADVPVFFRHMLATLIQRTNPWWLRLFPYGRVRVKAALSVKELQCFEAAGLFSDAPGPDIREWWDRLQHDARSKDDEARLRQGREGERLTIQYETRRLRNLGIMQPPRWISIDDNTAGYDVHSFDEGRVEPVAKLIEVKSCSRRPVEIFLTRNEWETAMQMAPNYRFHIWILPEEHLIELTPEDMEKHVPQDRGDGVWQTTRINLSPLEP